MKEQLEQALVDIIIKTTDTVGRAADFIVGELPDVVQQLIRYELISSILLVALILPIFVIITYIVVKQVEDFVSKAPHSNGDARISYIFLALVDFILLVIGVSNIFIALKIWIAPKIFLIEYAAQLVK